MTDAITFNVGNWTYVDLTKYNFCTDRDFYAVMIQVNTKEFEAGIGIDTHNPQGRSFGYFPDGSLAPYKALDAQDGNLMIRAEVDYSSTATVSIAPTINSPLNGATVKGTAAINASVNANVAIDKVEFYIDGNLASSDTTSPYAFDWDTTKAINGSHTIQVKAYDKSGNFGTSAVTTVTVDNTAADTTAPTCSITSPASGAAVKGTSTISANATDNVGVAKVEFYVDGSLIGTDTASPYTMDWDTTKATNGTHTIQVKAYDAANNVGTSSTIAVTVDNTVPDTTAPTCTITSPANGAVAKGVVSINANATDNVGVTKVEFYAGNNLIGTSSASPYGVIWDTTKAANGTCTIQVKAYDEANNVGTATITITVDNPIPDTTAPTCSITSPANGATVQGLISINANAVDNVGVTTVEFYVGGSLLETTSSSPYSVAWDTSKVANGNYSIQVKAYDAANNMGTSQITVTVSNSMPVLTPPTLYPSTKNNVTGKAITITFTDNSLWRSAITDVLVDGNSIKGKYTVSAGKLVISSGVFKTTGIYTVTVKAAGYSDATVTQVIKR